MPWGALRHDVSLSGLASVRWPVAPPLLVPLTGAAAARRPLFLWGQLAAVGELTAALGWPGPAGVGGLALALLPG